MTDFTYKLGTWKHPTTGQVRVYVSGGSINRADGDKVYFFAVSPTAINPQGIDGRIQSGALTEYAHLGQGQTPRDIGLYFVDAALSERGWQRATFDSIVAQVEGRGEIIEAPPFNPAPLTEAEITATQERKELLTAVSDHRATLEDWTTRIDRAVSRIKAAPDLMKALSSLKLSGSRRRGSKVWLKDIEMVDAFSSLIDVRLTPDDIAEVRHRCRVRLNTLRES